MENCGKLAITKKLEWMIIQITPWCFTFPWQWFNIKKKTFNINHKNNQSKSIIINYELAMTVELDWITVIGLFVES